MTFHIKELYWRIFYISFSFFLTFSFSLFYSQEFFYILSLSFLKFNQGFFIYTSLSEAFFSYLKFSFFFTILITLPSFIFHLYYFILPGLNKREASIFYNSAVGCLFLYLLSLFFVVCLILPISYEFFLGFQKESSDYPYSLTFLTKIDEYINFCYKTIIIVSIIFQLPGVLLLLIKFNILKLNFIIFNRKYFLLFSLIIGSLLTPPDIFSLLVIAIPIYLGFELLIFFFILYKEYSI